MIGIYIHQLKDSNKKISKKGKNPFEQWTFKKGDKVVTYPVYDYVDDDGYTNMGKWIEKAVK